MKQTPKLTPEQVREMGRITVPELAKKYGLKVFDTAIPQPVFDKLCVDGFDPWGKFVWSYDQFSTFGELFPLTTEAEKVMHKAFPNGI